MTQGRVLIDQEAIEKLVQEYPDAHLFFGNHRSIEHFAILVSTSEWLVMEADRCWLMSERVGPLLWEGHWFCPNGADTPTMRRLLDKFFMLNGAAAIGGTVPKGHPNERAARVINQALGARRLGESYLLTRARHLHYNKGARAKEV